jgi:hypothetical protein
MALGPDDPETAAGELKYREIFGRAALGEMGRLTPPNLPKVSLPGPAPSGRGLPVCASTDKVSPTLSAWCRTWWCFGRRRTDFRRLKGRLTLAEVRYNASDQGGCKQQERQATSPLIRHLRPKACRHSRGRNCAGVEKYSPEVEPSA